MAHAYTTKRGKNKMGKLGVRKDSAQNAENNLKSVSTLPMKFDGPKDPMFGSDSHLENGTRLHLQDVLRTSQQTKNIEKTNNEQCGNTGCSKTSTNNGLKLSECSSCHLVKYCSRECQLDHWR